MPPSFEIRAHYTPVEKEINDEKKSQEYWAGENFVVINETGQSTDIHVH